MNEADLNAMKKALTNEGAIVNVVAPHGGFIAGAKGGAICVAHSLLNTASVLFDAVYIPGAADSVNALLANAKTVHFVNEMYKHCKPHRRHWRRARLTPRHGYSDWQRQPERSGVDPQ